MTGSGEHAPSGAAAPGSDRRLAQRALARRKLAAMRLRTRRIRRTVVGFALGLFLLAFGGIYVQLATGHDPALSRDARKATETRTQATKAQSSESSGSPSSESGEGQSSGSSESEANSSPSTVRTSQS
jgi:hypothetical protein